MDRKPMPGDVVILVGSYSLCRKGDIGVIEGWVGKPQKEYLVVFRPLVFRGLPSGILTRIKAVMDSGEAPASEAELVCCSGGPAPRIRAEELKPWPHDYELTCWRWRDIPRQDGAENYNIRVPAWTWEGK